MGNDVYGGVAFHDPITTRELRCIQQKALTHSKAVEDYYHYEVVRRYRYLYHDIDAFYYMPPRSELSAIATTVASCQSIRHLNLSNLNLDDDQFIFFMSHMLPERVAFRRLSLANNSLSNKAVDHICWFIGINTTLVDIDLSHNKITDKGFEMLANTIKDHRGIKGLRIERNKQTETGTKWLLRGLFFNQSIVDLSLDVTTQAEAAYKDMFIRRNRTLAKTSSGSLEIR